MKTVYQQSLWHIVEGFGDYLGKLKWNSDCFEAVELGQAMRSKKVEHQKVIAPLRRYLPVGKTSEQ